MSAGSGGSLGEAVMGLLGAVGSAPKATYTAKSWGAMVTHMNKTKAGREALAGLATPRTVKAWSGKARTPSKANRGKIGQAYAALGGRGKVDVDQLRTRLTLNGQVDITNRKGQTDSRNRGGGQHAPLSINGATGNWDDLVEKFENGTLTDAEAEQLFIDDVFYEDSAFDGISGTIAFPGGSYTVSS